TLLHNHVRMATAAVLPKGHLTSALYKTLQEGTSVPWTSDFNHMRKLPRHIRMHKKTQADNFDPTTTDAPKIPKERVKFWNIVPGDQVRVRGRYGNRLRDVSKIRRLENLVEFPPTDQSSNTPSPAYSYASCQLYIGEYEFPPLPGSNEPRKLPVFAERLSTSPPVWNGRKHRWEWERYAIKTNPVVPHLKDQKIPIPWPVPKVPFLPPAGLYDTKKSVVAKVTYVPPAFASKLTAPLPRVPTEDEYIEGMSHPTMKPWFGQSPPVESYLHRELSNPHSRAKKMARWQAHLAYKKSLLLEYVAAEKAELNGRTAKEAVADATYKWRQKLSDEQEAERKRRWLTLAVAKKSEKKKARKTRKEQKRRAELTRLILAEGPNQIIPKEALGV
ncbi:unnamed protein product, partial [Mycena citricolor]